MTARDVGDYLLAEQNRSVKPTTLNSAIQEMIGRGLVRVVDDRKPFKYGPAVSQDETYQSLAGDLRERLFGGSLRRLLRYALGDRKPTEAEVAELEKFLEDAKHRSS